ncbi:MAG: phosphohydrolase [Paenibacillaceae bacterium]|jgi:hypothetical protein|nr:phosphohydrolase [Paenibacillaceae bacterium]
MKPYFSVGRTLMLAAMTLSTLLTDGNPQSTVTVDPVPVPLSSVYAAVTATAVAPQASSGFRFTVMSDIHVQKWSKPSQERFRQAMLDAERTMPDSAALIFNGDSNNGLPEDYEVLGDLMKQLPQPDEVYYAIGNHEFYKAWLNSRGQWADASFPNGETPEASIDRFLQFTGNPGVYYDKWIEGYHFLFLGSETYRQADPSVGESAWLSDGQLQWLENTISLQAEEGKPIFVFLHQPLPFTVAGSSIPLNSSAVIQHERLKEILSGYPQAFLFTGHSHWELSLPDTVVRQGFTMVNTSSVQEPYNNQDVPYKPEALKSEGLFVEVEDDGTVRIRGRNFAQEEWIPGADYRIVP